MGKSRYISLIDYRVPNKSGEGARQDIKAVADKGVVYVLLPAAAISLTNDLYADAPAMIDFGVPIALGTDFNPSCWVENQQLAITLACHFMKLTPAEAITATTIDAAHAISRANEIGSMEVGKKADVIVLGVPDHKFLSYRFGVNFVDKVIKNGKIVLDKGKQVAASFDFQKSRKCGWAIFVMPLNRLYARLGKELKCISVFLVHGELYCLS